jgi:hypothetical protein
LREQCAFSVGVKVFLGVPSAHSADGCGALLVLHQLEVSAARLRSNVGFVLFKERQKRRLLFWMELHVDNADDHRA